MVAEVYRLEPGCDYGCTRCRVSCATIVTLRDGLWRQLEEEFRLQKTRPHPDRADRVRALQSQMAAVEREFQRSRPTSPFEKQSRSGFGTAYPAQFH